MSDKQIIDRLTNAFAGAGNFWKYDFSW